MPAIAHIIFYVFSVLSLKLNIPLKLKQIIFILGTVGVLYYYHFLDKE